MKITRFAWFLAFPALFCLWACEETAPIVGSDDVFVLPGAKFTVKERKVSDNALVAKGVIRNEGSTKYSPTWYVEAEFYADSTFKYKLGGANQTFTFSLGSGEETGWELKFKSGQFDVSQYPGFAVKNLRAIRNQD